MTSWETKEISRDIRNRSDDLHKFCIHVFKLWYGSINITEMSSQFYRMEDSVSQTLVCFCENVWTNHRTKPEDSMKMLANHNDTRLWLTRLKLREEEAKGRLYGKATQQSPLTEGQNVTVYDKNETCQFLTFTVALWLYVTQWEFNWQRKHSWIWRP